MSNHRAVISAGLKEAQWSPLADSERKDSLSVNVEFVKFHLSRSRKLNIDNKSSKSPGPDQSQAIIRFSSECNLILKSVTYVLLYKI